MRCENGQIGINAEDPLLNHKTSHLGVSCYIGYGILTLSLLVCTMYKLGGWDHGAYQH